MEQHVLSIRWQPESGPDGSSCTDTAPDENDIRSAVAALEKALTPKGVEVVLEIFPSKAAGPPGEAFSAAGIRIYDRTLESWLKPKNRQNERITKIKEAFFIEGETPVLTPLAEGVVTAGLLAAEKLLQTEDEIFTCPADSTPQ